MITTLPYWTEEFPRPDDLPVAAEMPEQVDVAIVGGGYTGLNAARVLAKNGASVAVLERHTMGYGASSRNGGMATPGIKQSLSVIAKRYGMDLARLFWQASLDAVDLIDELVADEGIDCDWARNGHLRLACKASHFEAMKEGVPWYREQFGHTITLVPPDALSAEIGSNAYFGGTTDDFSGGLQPAKYVFGLARAAARHGVSLCEGCDVLAISKTGNAFNLQTVRGPLRAGEVIIATNGYTDRLVPKLKPRVFPVGSYIIVTEPLPPDVQQELSPRGRMFYDSKNYINYFRLTSDGRMLWGGRNNLSTDLDLHESAVILRKQMVRAFPQLRDVPITHSWTGKLGLTFDLMPHIGRVDGVHYAFGYCGHGLSIATYLGTEIGLLLAGKKQGSPFAEIPHQTQFFYRNEPWFIPFAAQWFRFLDWIS